MPFITLTKLPTKLEASDRSQPLHVNPDHVLWFEEFGYNHTALLMSSGATLKVKETPTQVKEAVELRRNHAET